MKTLRPYQEEATQATFDYFKDNSGNPLVIAPVAAGKSLLMAEFIRRACTLYPKTRILVLTHVKELLEQNAAELQSQWPDAHYTFYCAGLGQKKLHGQVVFASIQSIHKKAFNFASPIDLVLVDECHLISPKSETMYRAFLDDLRTLNSNLKIIGYTGTPFRQGSGRLTEGKERLFTDVAYEIPILYLIENGYLCPLITPDVKTKMSTEGVGTRNGDYIAGQLEKAVDQDHITEACVEEIIHHGAERNKWLIFAAGVAHCEHVRDAIRMRGISCEMVTGDTPKDERAKIIEDYKAGRIKCLVNVAVLTTGFNAPDIDLLAFMRPTRSPVLYVQCCGRAMRTHPSKENAMVLDFGGVIDELGAIDTVDIKAPSGSGGGGNGEVPSKQCPKCYAYTHPAVNQCEECSYKFPDPEVQIKKNASNAAILSTQIEPVEHAVMSVQYTKHEKKNGTPSMKVSYITLAGAYNEWVCFQHKGFAKKKAEKWHKDRSHTTTIPENIDEIVNLLAEHPDFYAKPSSISVRKEGKYDRIVNYDFSIKQEQEEAYEIPF